MYNECLAQAIQQVTGEKQDLTNLGLFLAQEKNVSALKVLNWLTIAIQEGWISKIINFNKKVSVRTKDGNYFLTHVENIPSRLIENPLYISKEVLDYISKTNKIDFNFRPYKCYSLKEMLTKILVDFQNPESLFYQSDNVAKKSLEILNYFSMYGTMHINDTMKAFLQNDMKEDISLELKKLIVQILSNQRVPHKKYDERIAENLEYKKRLLLQEQQNRHICEVDYRYFNNILVPKLVNHEFRLK